MSNVLDTVIGIAPFAVAGSIGFSRWAWRMSRAIEQLRDMIAPPDGPSLRTTVTDHGTRLRVLEQRINPDALPFIR